MIEKFNELYKRYESVLKFIIMVAPLIFAMWKYFGTYINLPERMDAFEKKAKRDSIVLVHHKHEIDSLIQLQQEWIIYTYHSLDSCRKRLDNNQIY